MQRSTARILTTHVGSLIRPGPIAENVIAGTDCGFAQGWSMAREHPSVQWAKLQALADGARLASDRLLRDVVSN